MVLRRNAIMVYLVPYNIFMFMVDLNSTVSFTNTDLSRTMLCPHSFFPSSSYPYFLDLSLYFRPSLICDVYCISHSFPPFTPHQDGPNNRKINCAHLSFNSFTGSSATDTNRLLFSILCFPLSLLIVWCNSIVLQPCVYLIPPIVSRMITTSMDSILSYYSNAMMPAFPPAARGCVSIASFAALSISIK